MAALFRCFYCGKHALRDCVPGVVTDVPMPTSCWVTCPWCRRGPMELNAPPIVYPEGEPPSSVWDFVRLKAMPVQALQRMGGLVE